MKRRKQSTERNDSIYTFEQSKKHEIQNDNTNCIAQNVIIIFIIRMTAKQLTHL